MLKIGTINSPDDRYLYQSWFNECIISALQAAHYHDAKAFSRQDVLVLYDVCSANSWSTLNVENAIQLLELFKNFDLHCLDIVYGKLGDRDETAWIKILNEIYGFSVDISRICFAHKESMIT